MGLLFDDPDYIIDGVAKLLLRYCSTDCDASKSIQAYAFLTAALPCTGHFSIGLLLLVGNFVTKLLRLLTFLAAEVTFCFLFGLLFGLKSPCPRC